MTKRRIDLPLILNVAARRYDEAANPVSKRYWLRTYLEALEMAATKAYPWNPLKGEPPLFNLRPVYELDEHLRELDHGETPELFRSAPKRGRKSPRRKQFFWAVGSALIDVLMARFNKSEEEAARAVAEQLRIRGLLGAQRSTSPAWKLLQTWRDKVRNGEKGVLARHWYDDALLFEAFYRTEPKLYGGLLDPTALPRETLSK